MTPIDGQLERSSLTILPVTTGGCQSLVHAFYKPPGFPAITLPVAVEWSSCHEMEISQIFQLYQSLDSVANTMRPRCLGFFEASEVGRFGFVFVSRSYIPTLSLRDLMRSKAKPSAEVRMALALAVVESVEQTWTWTQGQCRCQLWSSTINFHETLKPDEIQVSKPFLAQMSPPVISSKDPILERFLYIPPHLWATDDPIFSGTMKRLGGRGIVWALGVLLAEVADWRSFRETLSLQQDASKSEMMAALSRFQATLKDDGKVFKSPKVTRIVKFCFDGSIKGHASVQNYCNTLKQMLTED